VELYQGGEYWLYRKKYTDMRLVMAPELQAAFYGGISTTSPIRATPWTSRSSASRERQPCGPSAFSNGRDGADDGELVFVAGHRAIPTA